MSVDFKTLKNGDIVYVRGQAINGYIAFGDGFSIPASLAPIDRVEERPIQVGDKVVYKDDPSTVPVVHEVLGVRGADVWIVDASGNYGSYVSQTVWFKRVDE